MNLGLVLLTLGAVTPPQEGTGWTRFRGPGGSGQGSAPSVPEVFASADYNWRAELPGAGHSSPVVHGQRVFLTSAHEDGKKRFVVALKVADGSRAWTHEEALVPNRQHELNSYASSTPAIDDERVYVAWVNGDELEALALTHEGELLWKRRLGPYLARHGGGASPVVADGIVIVASDNESHESALYGLDGTTGEIVWRRPRTSGRGSFATPLVFPNEEGKLVAAFASTSHGITCLDAKTGELCWEVDGIFEKRCVASPILAGGLLFASAGTGGGGQESVAVELTIPEGKDRPDVRYRIRRALPYVPTAISVGPHLFLWSDSGVVSCLEAETGEELWRERVDNGTFYASPVCVDGRLYCLNTAGELFVVAAEAEFRSIGRMDLEEPTHATPAVADGVLYLRTLTHLISVGQRGK